jgi:large subunit ribosomal protein L21
MYAIIENGGKQYQVEEGRYFDIDLTSSKPEEKIEFDKVLLVNKDGEVEVGTPYLENYKVVGTVLKNFQGEKVIAYRYRKRKDNHLKKGFRAQHTRVMIDKIIA